MSHLHETTHIIGHDENATRLIQTASGPVEVKAFGELSAEITSGPASLIGRTITAFAWLETHGDNRQINITEATTGRRLEVVPMVVTEGSELPLTEAVFADMVPFLMEGCRDAAFARFREADDERLVTLFNILDQMPPLQTAGGGA
ncbi:hypothetical protein [Halomonas elongata]|uniref:Uncharacterized protein n=1 Tax=Halomonas elongata (strain ATCC 33173 / DSM 2581 / NBRC 15536 / NCIMB 2198 / 1H9) TaxID=768066 RepID=E1VA19_HALED|nr:hypothetical protein [Halomonas elongata]WBF17644.1 hypothetical protein LM502_16445 [Halomonas elongata]WPU46483.1 hypothetical protein SR933_14675 [Halomonas elongata DSM 2581]CBV43907.1 uncharacterized protein HELO_4023 [Halomonas elongata DSM 2581]